MHISLSAARLCYFRCHWCRSLAVVNCIVHRIVLTLSMLQMDNTRDGSFIRLLWLHHNHEVSVSYHKNELVSSHQPVGRWFFNCFVVRIFSRNWLTITSLLVSVTGWNSWLKHFAFMWIVFTFVQLFSFMWCQHNRVRKIVFRVKCVVLWKLHS